jgi:hypothetical protein
LIAEHRRSTFMTIHPNNPLRYGIPGDPRHHPAKVDPIPAVATRRMGTTSWIFGALAVLAIVAVVNWAMSDRTGWYNSMAMSTPQTVTGFMTFTT